jgi:endonuclease III
MAKNTPRPRKKPPSPALRATVSPVLECLGGLYPNHDTELTFEGPFQLLSAVILSAQCTDARVNLTTPALFARFPDAQAMAAGRLPEIEKLVQSCGFYRMKARALKEMANSLLEHHGGEVPNTMEDLVGLRGVGRKTASVVLNQAFGLPAIAVDTHVKRVAHRLGWTDHTNPEIIERDLMELVPRKDWASINGLLILHGRRLCKARKPLCGECPIKDYCRFFRESRASATINAHHDTRHPSRKSKQEVHPRKPPK